MQDIKVQVTEENVKFKQDLDISFAQLINTLIQLAAEDIYIRKKLLSKIPSKSKKDK